MTDSAVGRVLMDGRDTGSGFAITAGCALTAGHVVLPATEQMPSGRQRPVVEAAEPTVVYVGDRGEPCRVRVVVEYQPEGGEPIPVTRIEVNSNLDVAVLHLQRSAPAVLPVGPTTTGAEWRVATRPKASDPTLTGTVTDTNRRLRNQRSEETTLIQLWVREELGDYRGYSGSPVTSQPAGGVPGVLGVLVEQGRWRISPELGQSAPVANVLFAAPIDRVLTEFGLTGVTVGKSAGTIPLPVPFEVGRSQQLNRVIDALLTGLPQPLPGGLLAGLVGMGGSGKSVLAAAAARNPRVRDAFPDGRFWLELGPHPPLLQLQARLAAALGDSTPITDVLQGRARLSRLLAERRCLLVLDNVWAKADLSAFAAIGPMGGLLVTTRDAAIFPGNTGILLDELAPTAALQLLAGWTATLVEQLPTEAALVAQECGYLPLALALCGAMIAAGSHSWPQLVDLLRHAELDALHSRHVDYPHRSLAVALRASIDTLPPDARDRYMQLAVFNTEGPVPQAALQVLWGLDRQHTASLVEELAGKSLLRVDANRVSLHDLQMDYLVRCAAASLPTLHNQLLAAYTEQCHGGWATGPDDGYFHQHLAHHLHHAGRLPELRALLLDLDWMNAKLTTGNAPGLLADYDTLPSDSAMRLVAGALQLSAHVIVKDPGQLPSQLTGRLASQHDSQLRDLLQRTRRWPAGPWLRPLTGSLTPPGGPLLRTLTGHDDLVHSVAVSADGRRAVSGSDDHTVRVWDLDSGELVRTLTGHEDAVHSVAISADGRHAVSGSDDHTVRVWDLDSGELVRTLTGHHRPVRAVAVSADGRRAVSRDSAVSRRVRGTVRVWDLDSGELVRTLTGHDDLVHSVAVSADGRRAVSGHYDHTVRVWDLDSGELVRTLTGHDDPVHLVAISADGRRAVSRGPRGTVRVWDLDSGEQLRTLTGHHGEMHSVAVSADGRRVVSGSDDHTVRVWDLSSGELVRTLTVPDRSIAISADGRRTISRGPRGTVRVWDLDSGEPMRTPAGHDGPVHSVRVSADGRRAVSGGDDHTVRVWDLSSGELVRTLTGHHGPVRAVAVSADGRRAVSRGDNGAVRVWDLDSGKRVASAGQRLRQWFTWPGKFTQECFSASADARRAVGGLDFAVQVWDLDSGDRRLHTLTGHRGLVDSVAVSADGQRAVSGGDRTVRVWDLDTGELVHTLTDDDFVDSVAVTEDGRRAVSGGSYGTVRMWDLAQGVELASFVSDSSIAVLAITPPGTQIIAGTSTGPVHILEVCGMAGEPLAGRRSDRPGDDVEQS
jgi:WD40 repeat protein